MRVKCQFFMLRCFFFCETKQVCCEFATFWDSWIVSNKSYNFYKRVINEFRIQTKNWQQLRRRSCNCKLSKQKKPKQSLDILNGNLKRQIQFIQLSAVLQRKNSLHALVKAQWLIELGLNYTVIVEIVMWCELRVSLEPNCLLIFIQKTRVMDDATTWALYKQVQTSRWQWAFDRW